MTPIEDWQQLPLAAPEPLGIPASYWRLSLRPEYRGATQERLDALLASCREAGE